MSADGEPTIGDRYSLRRELGRGTSGRVWAAWDHQLLREVAVKILDPRVATDREIASRFEQEIAVTARLQHPGVVAVFEAADSSEGERCIVMGLARGRTLEERLDQLRGGGTEHWSRLPLTDRLGLCLKLLDIIAYAHSQNIVHRDLKPANVMVGDYGELWVLDWGLARSLREDKAEAGLENTYDEMFNGPNKPEAETLIMPKGAAEDLEVVEPGQIAKPTTTRSAAAATRTSRRLSTRISSSDVRRSHSQRLARSTVHGQVMGSPAYMSPEQARGQAETADQRTDIYSLGVILVELLTLHTPSELGPGETVIQLIQRVKEGRRRTLNDLWPEVPPAMEAISAKARPALQVISEWALAHDPQDRYPDCQIFAEELRILLAQLTESSSEAERRRLTREREADWLPAGRWDFAASPDPGPFTLPSIAWDGEPVGMVHHPELGGMLLGGCGLQVYPLDSRPGDDVRVRLDLELVKGEEIWVFVRGSHPDAGYQFRYGAYAGRWTAICRTDGIGGSFRPEFLSLRPLRKRDTTALVQRNRSKRVRLLIEAVGPRLLLQVDDDEPLVVSDLDPLTGHGHQQLAIATWSTQALIRQVSIERQRSPLMVPAHTIGNELLRQGLLDRATAFYRRFLTEHEGSDAAAEAQYMLGQALLRNGDATGAEGQWRDLLTRHFEHPIAQDAIFALARLRLEASPEDGLRRAVRELLSWQDSGDLVRTRFCIWVLRLFEGIVSRGLNAVDEDHLEILRNLLRGSPDEAPLQATYVQVVNWNVRHYISNLLDREDAIGLAAQKDAIARVRALGFPLSDREQRLNDGYMGLARHLGAINDPVQTIMVLGRGEEQGTQLVDFMRDCLALVSMGCSEQLQQALAGDQLTPIEHLLRAGLRLRDGDREGAEADLQWCFRLTDVLETERTSPLLLFAARLGCFALGYLPWELIEEGLATVQTAPVRAPLTALAAWLAECLERNDIAERMYRSLDKEGSGFVLIARQGLGRILAT